MHSQQRTLTKSEYLQIVNTIVSSQYSSDTLDFLKTRFHDSINSRRTFDNINDITDLVRVLQKRDILNEFRSDNLQFIANESQQRVNAHRIAQSVINSSEDINYTPEEVREILCNGIGNRWSEFARHLGVTEGEIDDLEENYRFFPDKIRRILKMHEKNRVKFIWRSKLLEALIKIRRNDLHNQISVMLEADGL